jgi:hypothetical protein
MSAYSEKIRRAKEQGLFKVADVLNREVTLTISHLLEDAVMFNREIDILCFVETGKQLQVNLTNGEWLIENFGDDPNDWPANRVTLYVGEYEFKGGEKKQGIRLKRADASITIGGKVGSNTGSTPKHSLRDDLEDEIPNF